MASNVSDEVIPLHNEMVFEISKEIFGKTFEDLKELFRNAPLTSVDIARIDNIQTLFKRLIDYETINYGNYKKIETTIRRINPRVCSMVQKYAEDINKLQGNPVSQGDVTATSANSSDSKEIHHDLKPMIETTIDKIKNEKKEKKFYPTKGFVDAKVKLKKNRVIVIKGNSGDGKTAIAVQLLHWLSQEEGAGQPLQLHKIEDLRLLAPSLKLITFIDDIFGKKDVCQSGVQEWNKRIEDIKAQFVDEQTEANYLIITVRNEVFNFLEKCSLGKIFTKDNIIDLSSCTYQIPEEKKELLEMYRPKTFHWSEEEKSQILAHAPNIGFPQCCQLFYNSGELQKERVKFFENPFDFLVEALSKLPECSALLYLFLSDRMIKVIDLDPNNKNVNHKLLEEAFEINLIDGENDSTKLTYKKKVQFVREDLKRLLGSYVVKVKNWWFGDVYEFSHDSIYVAVALLYGKVTPIGYIQKCPLQSLSYITTSETDTNMVVISSKHYTEMCERLRGEFECKHKPYCTSIASLDVWECSIFFKQFKKLFDDKKVVKLDMLNAACWFGVQKCVLYLLSKGVKPDKDTVLSLVRGYWNDSNRQVCLLQKMFFCLNDETKLAVLNTACLHGAEECVVYLLSEGVKPDKDTALLLVSSGYWNDSNRQVCLLQKMFFCLNDETKLAVLNTACLHGAEECVVYLLSEGVKPDKDTALSLVSSGYWNDSNRTLRLLRKIVHYLKDETKLAVLNKACLRGAEECVVCLLSEGVKPDKDTAVSLVSSGYWNDSNRQVCLLRKMFFCLNDETKLALLNTACLHGAEECVVYLLSEGVKPDKYTVLSLVRGYWNDSNRQVCLLQKMFFCLNDETKLAVLNKACLHGAEECVVYLLSEGVKPDKDTALSLVSSGYWNGSNRTLRLLRKIVHYLKDETRLAVLNKACLRGAEECVVYLLSEGVKPDKDTAVSLVSGYWNDSNRQVCLLRKMFFCLNDETKLAVLNTACLHGAEECVVYLLSEGVKPDKDTVLSLVRGYWNDSNRQVCLLQKMFFCLNDETKLAVLNTACLHGAEECVVYLLSEGIKT